MIGRRAGAAIRLRRDQIRRWWYTPEVKRVDRDRMYVWVHAGLALVGTGIMARPEVGLLAVLSIDANRTLAAMILTGSSLALIGSALGSRWFVPDAATDLRIPYRFAVGGQVSVVASMSYYAVFITTHSDLVGTLAGGLSIMIGAGCTQYTVVAMKELSAAERIVDEIAD